MLTPRDICPRGGSISCTRAALSTTCRVGSGPDFWRGSKPPRVPSASTPISSSRTARSTWSGTSASITSAPVSSVAPTRTGGSGGAATGRSRVIRTGERIGTAWRSSSRVRLSGERRIPASLLSAREELQHQAVDFGGVLVRRPVAGAGNAVHVERADRLADLADQELSRSELGVVPLAPEEADPARGVAKLGEVAEERPAAAHLAAVEAGPADAVDLDVERLLADAPGIAEHVDEQVVPANLAEQPLVVPGFLVAPGRPVAEAA